MVNEYEIRGDMAVVFIETTSGIKLETIIDTADLEKVKSIKGKWLPRYSKSTYSYYVCGSVKGRHRTKTQSLHRFLFGRLPRLKYIDHINHDTLDNRRSVNLRVVTPSENRLNARVRIMTKNGIA